MVLILLKLWKKVLYVVSMNFDPFKNQWKIKIYYGWKDFNQVVRSYWQKLLNIIHPLFLKCCLKFAHVHIITKNINFQLEIFIRLLIWCLYYQMEASDNFKMPFFDQFGGYFSWTTSILGIRREVIIIKSWDGSSFLSWDHTSLLINFHFPVLYRSWSCYGPRNEFGINQEMMRTINLLYLVHDNLCSGVSFFNWLTLFGGFSLFNFGCQKFQKQEVGHRILFPCGNQPIKHIAFFCHWNLKKWTSVSLALSILKIIWSQDLKIEFPATNVCGARLEELPYWPNLCG